MKDPRVEKPKSRPQESKALAFQRLNSAEISEKAWKEKKKNDCQNKRDSHAQKGSIPATRVNITNANNSKKRNSFNRRNPSKVVCYNYNKKVHYLNKSLEPPKSKKPVPVLATSASVTEASKGAQKVILDQVPCIYYPVQFRKDKRATI